MLSWKHSGFSINNKVHIRAGDRETLANLAEYISRCPFSLTRIINVNPDGKVIYRAVKKEALPYPEPELDLFKKPIPRNFQVFDPLNFLADVTTHIPKKGAHQVLYYGWYSNKSRGLRSKDKGKKKADTENVTEKRKTNATWAQLIRMVYEVDPLICPECGSEMRIISFIEQKDVIRKILEHHALWKDPPVWQPEGREISVRVRADKIPIPEETVDFIPDYSTFDDILFDED